MGVRGLVAGGLVVMGIDGLGIDDPGIGFGLPPTAPEPVGG
jgi:hypothetical protein